MSRLHLPKENRYNDSMMTDKSINPIYAVLMAGGSGERISGKTPKQFLPWNGGTIFEYVIDMFSTHPGIDSLVIVVHRDWKTHAENLIKKRGFGKIGAIVDGGETRQDSSRNGLAAISSEDGWGLFHDMARPLLSPNRLDDCLNAFSEADAFTLAIPIHETILQVSEENGPKPKIEKIPDRRLFWKAQTPQGFRLRLIRNAHQKALADGLSHFTDDCGLIHHYQLSQILIIPGDESNIKITYPQDYELAKLLFAGGGLDEVRRNRFP